MTGCYHVDIDDARVAARAGYVYLIFAPELPVLYVGQTRAFSGALGRLTQHLTNGNHSTFRQRCQHILGLEELDVGPIRFFACDLGRRREFHSDNSTYREAVEYVVQLELLKHVPDMTVHVGPIVSRVAANGYTSLDWVQRAASRLVEQAIRWLDHSGASTPSRSAL